MVNITNAPSSSSTPAASVRPTTFATFQHDTTQYTYATPSGTTNDIQGGVPQFIGTVRLFVSLAAGTATWTGFAAGSDGQHVILVNTDNTSTLNLSTGGTGLGDTHSLIQNRFFGQNDYKLPPGAQLTMVYSTGIGWCIG